MIAYLILALVQGLTEFLPVSSSGHLGILSQIFAKQISHAFEYAIVLHMGTLLAIFVFFFKDILAFFSDIKNFIRIGFITLVTGILALILKKVVVESFSSMQAIGMFYLLAAILLISSKWIKPGNKVIAQAQWLDLGLIGLFQGLAVLPGVSRSGMTLLALLLCKFSPSESFRMAFIVGIPAILGAFIMDFKEISNTIPLSFTVGGGFFIAFISGVGALLLLRPLVKGLKLYLFGIYCLILGGVVLFVAR